ncbi:ABC transporter ATP-binding protein [Persicobacter psychrovividus]|uniref:ATP-binding protein n=1 Tax=Persicobacter psychrovividus TaxID=387638 RepID=A0ABN6L925_9BACT|nr:ATP-binding protein [Persicobacter psychrovividus]
MIKQEFKISAQGVGKRFINEWIFRHFDYTFEAGNTYAVTGPNGSGKSSIMKVLAGITPPTQGNVHYEKNSAIIKPDAFFKELVYVAPYLELPEELSLREFLLFHYKFKELKEGFSIDFLIKFLSLEGHSDKPIKFFSSGMKQRVRLGLAFATDSPLVFLDEPTSNLDEWGIEWYHQNCQKWLMNQCVIIGSNQPFEYKHANFLLNINLFKK